jgi:predicted amidohydrolase
VKLALAAFGVSPPPNLNAFINRIDQLAAQAALAGADLLALPEYTAMVLAGAFVQTPDIQAELQAVTSHAEQLLEAYTKIAARHGLYILAGTLPVKNTDGKIRNHAPFCSPTGQMLLQDKQFMTRFEAEEWGISSGEPPKIFETTLGPIGISICYDAEFPLHVRAQVAAGAKLILIPTCTDTQAGFNRVSLSARARALENQCFTAVIPLVGTAPWSASIDTNTGHSAIYGPCDHGFAPHGIIAQSTPNEPGLLITTLDFATIDTVRREGAVLNHHDWPPVPPSVTMSL